MQCRLINFNRNFPLFYGKFNAYLVINIVAVSQKSLPNEVSDLYSTHTSFDFGGWGYCIKNLEL